MEKLQPVHVEIDPDILSATFEAMRDLKTYYERDAASLARLGGEKAAGLANERLDSAAVAAGLCNFYGALL